MIKIDYKAEGVRILMIGSESGIGKALSHLIIQSGGTVYGVDILPETEVDKTEGYHYQSANPVELNDLQGLKSKFELISLTGLVCLSGTIKHYGTVQDLTAKEWQEVFDISFKSCYNACKVFAPLLSKSSSIVNMSSGLAFGGQANYGPYTNAKAAINSLSKTLATELAPDIRVNSVAPGAVDTGFIYDIEGKMRFDKESYLQIVPLKTLATPEEISNLIMFLLSNASSHITGQCIHINGGAMMT